MHRGSPNERFYDFADASQVTLASSSPRVSSAVPDGLLPILPFSSTALVEASSVESLDSSESLSLCSSSSNCSLGSPVRSRSSNEVAHYNKEAEPLCGSVPEYDKHLFICYGENTPGHVLDRCAWDEMPKALGAAVKKKSDQLRKKVMYTVCQGDCDSDLFDGTVMLFPDMLEYRSLTRFDVKLLVQEALVEERNFKLKPRKLQGTHVFICCDPALGSPCASEGPDLYRKFKEEVARDGLNDRVKVWKTSSFFNHKEPGNVIIFRHRSDGGVDGDWYGMVKSSDVPKLLEHIERGNILEHLWRGRMGLDEEQQREEREHRLRSRLEMDKCRPDSGMALIAGVPLKSMDLLSKCGDGRYVDSADGDDGRCLSESSSCSGREEELSFKKWAKAPECEEVLGLGRRSRNHYALVDGRGVVMEEAFLKRMGRDSPLVDRRPPPPVPPCRSGGSWSRTLTSCRTNRTSSRSLNCRPNSGSCIGVSGGGIGNCRFGGSSGGGQFEAGVRTQSGSSGGQWRRSNSAPAGYPQEHRSSVRYQQNSPSSSSSTSSSSPSSSIVSRSKYLSSFLRSNCRLEWESLDTIGVTSLAIAVFSTAVAFQAVGSLMSSSCCSQQ